jgi:uncharacterized protein YdeI (YjbR/CyaY-like superfamily)
MHPDVDQFLNKQYRWKEELIALREIVLESGLKEDFKWRQPCYTHEGVNILILGSFKASCMLSFFKGVLLTDQDQLLEFAGEHSQSAKLLRFRSVDEINRIKNKIQSFIKESIALETMGAKIPKGKAQEIPVPNELKDAWKQDKAFDKAFHMLTPGRQRAYLMFFTAAKQTETRLGRIQKYMPRIMDGKGINDCTCGLSQKMPACDGSHRMK